MKNGIIALALGLTVVAGGSVFANGNDAKADEQNKVEVKAGDVRFDGNEIKGEYFPVLSKEEQELLQDMKPGESITLEDGSIFGVVDLDAVNNDSIFVPNGEPIQVLSEEEQERLGELFKDLKPGETKTLEDGSVIGAVGATSSTNSTEQAK